MFLSEHTVPLSMVYYSTIGMFIYLAEISVLELWYGHPRNLELWYGHPRNLELWYGHQET